VPVETVVQGDIILSSTCYGLRNSDSEIVPVTSSQGPPYKHTCWNSKTTRTVSSQLFSPSVGTGVSQSGLHYRTNKRAHIGYTTLWVKTCCYTILLRYIHRANEAKSYILPCNSSQVETCTQQPSVSAYLEIMGALWDQFPPTVVVSTQPPIQEHCIIVCSGL